VGASGLSYVAYQPDPQAALDKLRQRVFETGDYWWAVPYEFGKPAADFPNRPRTEAELWAEEIVQERPGDGSAGARSCTTPQANPPRSTSGASRATDLPPPPALAIMITDDLGRWRCKTQEIMKVSTTDGLIFVYVSGQGTDSSVRDVFAKFGGGAGSRLRCSPPCPTLQSSPPRSTSSPRRTSSPARSW
jgi:hypothetical protein